MNITPNTALIIVDPQNDFCPGGALAVEGGNEIFNDINNLAQQFIDMGGTVVLTQDWHPEGHKSFASSNSVEPFSVIELPYGPQVMWPDHCVQGTMGAAFHMDIVQGALGLAHVIIRKGMNPNVDSYSAFLENDKSPTGLAGYLRSRNITTVVVVGLAYDYCVGYTAIDAANEGFEAIIMKNLTRAIASESVQVAEANFFAAGVQVI